MPSHSPLPVHDPPALKQALFGYDDDQLRSIIDAAEAVMGYRKRKAFWREPPERYWYDLRYRCGHMGRPLIPFEEGKRVAGLLKGLGELDCLVCVARVINDTYETLLWQPEPLVGVSVKQTEFGEQVRLKSLNAFIGRSESLVVEEGPLYPFLQEALDNTSASWWIDMRYLSFETVLYRMMTEEG